jgi:hypothetical protein
LSFLSICDASSAFGAVAIVLAVAMCMVVLQCGHVLVLWFCFVSSSLRHFGQVIISTLVMCVCLGERFLIGLVINGWCQFGSVWFGYG